jgi:ATP synthase protein I
MQLNFVETMAAPSGFVAIVGLQAALIALAALVMGVFRDTPAAWSTLAGGAACWVPSALFAWRLSLALRYRPEHVATVFFIGEFAKMLLTVLILFAMARVVHTIFWPGAVLGVIVAVKANWLALLLRR